MTSLVGSQSSGLGGGVIDQLDFNVSPLDLSLEDWGLRDLGLTI